MYSELYKRDTYLNKDIPYIFGRHIYEYDMHHAGISITKQFHLLPEESINKIEKKAKNKKDIAVLLGKVQQKDKDYKEKLAKGFVEARRLFFEANKLEDNQILSIKKDAIFTLRPCKYTEFDYITYSLKHHYTSYLKLDKYELYYNLDELDVKGIDDVTLINHKDFMIDLIKRYFYKMENENKESTLRYLRVMIDKYKRLELDCGYYRSFDRESNYVTKDGEYVYSEITPMLLPDMEIGVNYMNILMKLVESIL